MSRPCIRKANLEDISALANLIDQLGYKIAQPILIQNIKSYLQDAECSLFVAMIEGTVVGCIALDVAQTFHRPGKHMRVVSLVVDRCHRRKGIGKLLLQAAETQAKQQRCWVIEVTSSSHRQKEGTHDFYIEQGYLINGIIPSEGFSAARLT